MRAQRLTKTQAIRRTLAFCSMLLAWSLSSGLVRGEVARLEGQFIQGGVIFGHAVPGAKVVLNGRVVRVSSSGQFVFGFGRDAPKTAQLEITLPDGTSDKRTLQVEQRTYKTQRIDGLPPKMVTPPEKVLARIRKENKSIAAARAVDRPEALFESGFIWPAIGRISGVFGSQRILNGKPRRPHFGLDIAAPAGTPIQAPADGVVAIAQKDMYYTGGTVVLDHGHGLTSVYSHMRDVSVKQGQILHQGDPLGTIGATGRATGAHLDWRFNWFKERLDPAFFVPPMPQ